MWQNRIGGEFGGKALRISYSVRQVQLTLGGSDSLQVSCRDGGTKNKGVGSQK